jgi:hypothetical protein
MSNLSPTDTVAFAFAWIFIESAIPMIVPSRFWAGVVMLVVGLGFLAVALGWLPSIRQALAWKYSLIAFVLAGAGGGVCVWALVQQFAKPLSASPSDLATTSQSTPTKSVVLVSYYSGGPVPITVPAHSTVYVLPLRARVDSSVVLGIAALFSIDNGTDKTQTWPPVSIQPKRKPIWAPEVSWLCEIKNMGETPILDATLTFTAHFGEDVQTLPVRIGALNVGDTFKLSIVNETSA